MGAYDKKTATMEMTRKRIVGFTGTGLALLGLIILIAGYATANGKWDDENCCKNKKCNICTISCLGIASNEGIMEEMADGGGACCYTVRDKASIDLVIFGLIAVGTVVVTSLILECGDKICCECCQKCTAIILGVQNILGMVMVVLLLLALTVTVSTDAFGCDATTVYDVVGTKGTMMAGTVFILLGTLCACIVTFIECCCDDAESGAAAKRGPDATATV